MVASSLRTILLVAAESFELKYIVPRSGERWIFAANGPGPELAGQAAGQAMDGLTAPLDAVVSVGLCGALIDELEIGDIVIGTSVNGVGIDVPESTQKYAAGPIVSVDHVAQTVDEKLRLRQTGAIAVEMESAAVLARARGVGVPFYCIRAVSDTSSEGFELDLNAARDNAGRFRVGRILAQAVQRPLTGVPELLRLRRNSESAAKALGEFIGNCSF